LARSAAWEGASLGRSSAQGEAPPELWTELGTGKKVVARLASGHYRLRRVGLVKEGLDLRLMMLPRTTKAGGTMDYR